MPKDIKQYDVNPQMLSAYVTQTGANTYTQTEITLPINPGATVYGGKVRVMEILKLFVFEYTDTLSEDAQISWQLTYSSETDFLLNSEIKNALALGYKKYQMVTSGAVLTETPQIIDLTDGAGNGVLVAAQSLFFAIGTGGQGAVVAGGIKILYRFKDIPVVEFIGIATQG